MRILDVGCGGNKLSGSVGVDRLEMNGVDVVHDLDRFPWPFEDDCFDVVIFKHSIAHLEDIVRVMEEVNRIAKPGGSVEIITPHFSCDNYFTDPTHKHPMGYRSMNYVCDNIVNWKYKYSDVSFDLVESYISFGEYGVYFNEYESKRRFNIHYFLGIEYVVNKFKRIYEKFFCFMVPASTIYFKLNINK